MGGGIHPDSLSSPLPPTDSPSLLASNLDGWSFIFFGDILRGEGKDAEVVVVVAKV